MPKISVIVPVYKVEKYLAACLDSLVNQTIDDMEIIVINDGSPDNSQAIIDEYAKKYPQIKAYKKENGGIADTRNFGLSKVSGEYFGFLDSDDVTDIHMFEDLYNKAIQTNAEVVVSNFKWVLTSGERIQKEGPYDGGKDMMINLFATLWNKIYKTSFIKSLNINFPKGNRYEDACFLYRLAPNVKNIAFVDKEYVSYIQHGTSITHTSNEDVKNMITVFDIIDKYFADHNIYDEYHDELEYLHIKFFLGNSFLRSCHIKDKTDRNNTIMMGFNLLNERFPNWKKNHYLNDLGGMKNKYFKMVNKGNIKVFSFIFRHFKKIEV